MLTQFHWDIKRRLNEFASPNSDLKEALELAQEYCQQESVAHCYSELAHIALAQKAYAQAKNLFKNSFSFRGK
jgi:hypothetical protein